MASQVDDMDYDKISDAIAQILSRDFKRIAITKVDVAQDFDHDGDPILRVDVVVDGARTDLDGKEISSAVRRIRPALEDVEGTPFPVIAFIDSKEYETTRA